MSKFTYEVFYGGYDALAVSKERYTKEQAIEIAKEELCHPIDEEWTLAIGDYHVRHRAGINEDGEPCVGWWLEYSEHARSCPAWAFHVARFDEGHHLERGYERIVVEAESAQAGEGER